MFPMCVCCGSTNGYPLRFSVRGISGGRHQGRVLVRGASLCDDCAEFFYSF